MQKLVYIATSNNSDNGSMRRFLEIVDPDIDAGHDTIVDFLEVKLLFIDLYHQSLDILRMAELKGWLKMCFYTAEKAVLSPAKSIGMDIVLHCSQGSQGQIRWSDGARVGCEGNGMMFGRKVWFAGAWAVDKQTRNLKKLANFFQEALSVM